LLVLQWLGFRSTYIKIKHEKRFEGKSSYTFSKLVKHAIDGITSQSEKLLRISIKIGFSIFVIAILWAIALVVLYFKQGAQPGYTSLMVMILLSTGLILMSIGIAGIYIGKIFEQAKGRPLYVIDRKVNF
jgi:dolichol-phosphate mannosyltransferase